MFSRIRNLENAHPVTKYKVTKRVAAGMFFLLLAGCWQDVTLGTRSMTDSLPVVTIPGAPVPRELGISVGVAIDSAILGIEADSQFLTFARIRNLTLEIQDSSDVDPIENGALDSFDFLSGLSISIRAVFNGETQEEIIAFLPDGDPQIGTFARSLTLAVVDKDVLDYLQAPGGYQLVLNISGSVPPDAIDLGGTVRYRVGVGL